MFPEDQINALIETFDQMDDPTKEALIDEFAQSQPDIIEFIYSETDSALPVEEQDYLLANALVIWKACQQAGYQDNTVSLEELLDREDANWERFQSSHARTFSEKLDVFFEGYPEEDLLAFLEDAVCSDPDEPITPESQELLFVHMKSLLDAFIGYSQNETSS